MEEKIIKKSGAAPCKPKPDKNGANKKSVGGGKPKRKLNINVGMNPQPKLISPIQVEKDILLPHLPDSDTTNYSKLTRKEKEELLIKTQKELREAEKEIEESFNPNL